MRRKDQSPRLVGISATISSAILASVAGCATPAAVPPAPDTEEYRNVGPVDTLATFSDATALDVAPDGTIYVTDSGRDALVVLGRDGLRLEGGPGTEAGQFDGPADVDASGGLVILVADAGNRRLQRFSREFRHLGNIDFDARRGGAGTFQPQRPVSVATSAENDLFVVDASAGVVHRWDAALRAGSPIGGFGSGSGTLTEPVAVATDGERFIYVADRALESVVIYDLLGSFVGRIASRPSRDLVNVDVSPDGTLIIVTRTHVYLHRGGGSAASAAFVGAPEPLVDASIAGNALLLLSSKHLFRTVHSIE